MTRTYRTLIAAALLCGPGLIAWSQVSIAPPPATTSTAPATAAVVPPADIIQVTKTPATATAPSSTLPSAEKILQNLLNEQPAPPVTAVADTNPAVTPPVQGAAPAEPKANRIREGQYIWKRIGRLVKDDKTGQYMFAFDADGKAMNDPPMALLPSHLLQSMEDASEKATRSVKFRITGEVTEYHGKNFMLVRDMQAIQDLNQGIGK